MYILSEKPNITEDLLNNNTQAWKLFLVPGKCYSGIGDFRGYRFFLLSIPVLQDNFISLRVLDLGKEYTGFYTIYLNAGQHLPEFSFHEIKKR